MSMERRFPPSSDVPANIIALISMEQSPFEGEWFPLPLLLCNIFLFSGAQAGICNIENVNNTSKIWAPAICPLENECLNKKHNCVTHEDCIDQEIGFLCKCKQGYERNST